MLEKPNIMCYSFKLRCVINEEVQIKNSIRNDSELAIILLSWFDVLYHKYHRITSKSTIQKVKKIVKT